MSPFLVILGALSIRDSVHDDEPTICWFHCWFLCITANVNTAVQKDISTRLAWLVKEELYSLAASIIVIIDA